MSYRNGLQKRNSVCVKRDKLYWKREQNKANTSCHDIYAKDYLYKHISKKITCLNEITILTPNLGVYCDHLKRKQPSINPKIKGITGESEVWN